MSCKEQKRGVVVRRAMPCTVFGRTVPVNTHATLADKGSVQQERPRFLDLAQFQVGERQEPARATHARRDVPASEVSPLRMRPKVGKSLEVDGRPPQEQRVGWFGHELPVSIDNFLQSFDAAAIVGLGLGCYLRCGG